MFDQSSLTGLLSNVFTRLIQYLPTTIKINLAHALIMGSICTTLYQNTLNGFVSFVFTRLYIIFYLL